MNGFASEVIWLDDDANRFKDFFFTYMQSAEMSIQTVARIYRQLEFDGKLPREYYKDPGPEDQIFRIE